MQRQKWKHEQCSYCGNKNTQFICWRCHESDIEQLREEIEARDNRIETLEFKFNELIDVLRANKSVSKSAVFTKVTEAES